MDDTTRGKVRRVLALAKDPAIEAAEMLLDKPDPHYLVTEDAADQGRLGLDPGDTLAAAIPQRPPISARRFHPRLYCAAQKREQKRLGPVWTISMLKPSFLRLPSSPLAHF